MSAEPFDLAAVERNLADTHFSGTVQHFASVGSTNQLALEAAAAGARSGVWVASEQTAGRGRAGHTWHSSPGDGLYVSALVTPRIALNQALKLPLAAGLAAQAAILQTTGLQPDLRWPNDLLFGDSKCGGILVESVSDNTSPHPTLRYAVIGVGINVNHATFPTELRHLATSLYLQAGRRFPLEPLLAAFLRHLDRELAALHAGDILARFTAASTWVTGKRVTVGEADGYTGITRGLDSQGFLRVQDDYGTLRTVLSGGVRSAQGEECCLPST